MSRTKKSLLKPLELPAPETPGAPPPDSEAVAPRHGYTPFSVIDIGASAGGLEALELFLRHVPAKSGMAYVIVQHLGPTQKALLPELLQRVTSMEVVPLVDSTRIRPDCVFVIPPNSDRSILHGGLHLLEPSAPRSLRLPIDFFLRSLAENLQCSSVGMILSGTGSDGTLGLRAIREHAGVAFVQEPSSTKFDGMPGSAIVAGAADVEALPGKIIDYLRHVPGLVHLRSTLGHPDQYGLERIVILLRAKTGQDFSLYKQSTLCRRFGRRMGRHQIGSAGWCSRLRILQRPKYSIHSCA